MLNRSFFSNGFTMEERFHYGGQAVIEGVMMRGQKAMVTVVRRPSGSLAVATQTLYRLDEKNPVNTGHHRFD